MSQDVFELLKQKEQESKKEKKFYVYYAPSTGEIIHLRNYLEEDSYPFITILESDLEDSIENFRSKNYIVVEKNKKMKLIKVDNITIDQFNIDDLIYQVPKIVLENRNQIKKHYYDIVIEQNNKDKVFRLKFSSETKEKFLPQLNLRQLSLAIYVTAESDPHILYQTLEFKIQDLLDNQYYTINYNNFDGSSCNLFSRKYFQTYVHADIR